MSVDNQTNDTGAPTTSPIPPDGCTCGALWTVKGKHGKPDCPYLTGTQELREAIIKSLDSFGFQGAKRKCYTPKHGKDAYIIEEWSAETLATFIVDDLEALIASKVTELDNLKLVCNAELPSTYTDPLTGKKLYNEAYVASKVEEARIESERAGIYWVRNKVVTSGRDESGKFYLLDDAFVSEVDAYLEALQSKEGDS